MKRRLFLQALAATPAVPALAQEPAAPAPETPRPLTFSTADAAAETKRAFFDDRQFATLRRLSQLLSPPPADGGPGAIETRTPEFLDFLLSESPHPRQLLYLSGLDSLEFQSQTTFRKPFAATDDAQAAQLLAPLRQKWTTAPPDPFTAFLRQASEDARLATRNSLEWSQAGKPGGIGQVWKPVD